MPQKDGGRYDPDTRTGNPTRSTQVKDLIKRIRSIMDNNSSAKPSRKHAPKASDIIANKKTKLNPPAASKPAGQPAPRPASEMATATILRGSSTSSTAEHPPLPRDLSILAMQVCAECTALYSPKEAQLQSPVTSSGNPAPCSRAEPLLHGAIWVCAAFHWPVFILPHLTWLSIAPPSTLSASLEQFRQTLAATNIGIMAEVQRLSVLKSPPPVVPAVTQTKRPATKVASTVAQTNRAQPVSAVVNGSGAQMKHSSTAVVENNRPTSQGSLAPSVAYEFMYLHPDGVRRRGKRQKTL